MKGFLVVDDVSLEETKELMNMLNKKGRWFSEKAMNKIDSAVAFAVLTHGFSKVESEEMFEFKEDSE